MFKNFFFLSPFVLFSSSAIAMELKTSNWMCNATPAPHVEWSGVSSKAQSLAVVVVDKASKDIVWFGYGFDPKVQKVTFDDAKSKHQRGLNGKSESSKNLPCKSGSTLEVTVMSLSTSPKFFAAPTFKDFEASASSQVLEKVSKEIVMK